MLYSPPWHGVRSLSWEFHFRHFVGCQFSRLISSFTFTSCLFCLRCSDMSSLYQIPHFTLLDIASFLWPSEVLTLASTSRPLSFLRQDDVLWQSCLNRDVPLRCRNDDLLRVCSSIGTPAEQYQIFKIGYKIPKVQWSHMHGWDRSVPDREGHDQVVIDDNAVFLRFGFLNDLSGYLMKIDPASGQDLGVVQLSPVQRRLSQVYGARMTYIGNHDVVTYGGCMQGGYHMMSERFVLTHLDLENNTLNDESIFLDERFLPARSYHGQCLDSKTMKLYIHGGLLQDNSCDNKLYCINLNPLLEELRSADPQSSRASMCVENIPMGDISARFGHSMALLNDKLYIAGGYTGSGIFQAYDGVDLTDVVVHDLESGVTRTIAATTPVGGFLGRCHTVNTYGPLLVYYGGTMKWSNEITIFDTRDESLYRPATCSVYESTSSHESPSRSRRPAHRFLGRVAHASSIVGTRLIITGGCHREHPLMLPQVADLAFCLREGLAVARRTWTPPEGDLLVNCRRAFHKGTFAVTDSSDDAGMEAGVSAVHPTQRHQLMQILLTMLGQGGPSTEDMLTAEDMEEDEGFDEEEDDDDDETHW